ncbi:uncharacterized protein NECHADRAFT_39200 [Fusarium vanettenii 77-13-4]|uniref:OPT family small oligopeptide transporter n=1 Tax=Fusarium vanettenii (strain ATCC MYA-4622 / CBS 123669 / FGSC 9596 / NRRL 45880 / 77-13-4) TaxID=660122 RepID=C7Z8B2_FUSV7|nr:uncharacterized protein NECHADRAFT_39200 [Fusarium vanettenii 77-13-4]EEU39966.1 hypothetical protein NECHADRAFT_39200 [Fusarium vanettenii 77-13-4]
MTLILIYLAGKSVEEVLSAAGVDFRPDDPSLPCLTIRMWTIGIAFCLVGSGVNTLYTLRFPSVSLSQSAIQFLAYPIGKAWQYVVPDWGVTVFGQRHSLNPGPFNYKENMLIYILANLSFLTRLSADVLTEQRVFYGLHAGWGFELLATLTTILYGFALAGLGRSLVVEPKDLVWPGVLGNTALNAALHSSRKEEVEGTVSRYRFFLMAFMASFCWYWLPDFLFPALGYFTWVCWIAPKSPVVNQIFGMKSGIGLLPFTFDWSQIAYIGSPLVVPTWAILNVLGSLVLWIYVVTPALYYTNTWWSAYLPMQSNSIYDNMGQVFNVSKVINKRDGFAFDLEKYQDYSPIYLPVTYALNTFGLAFATISSLFVWLFLEKRQEIALAFRTTFHRDGHDLSAKDGPSRQKLQPQYEEVPAWWYGAAALVALGVGLFAHEYYPVQLRWYGVIFAMAVSAIFFIPVGTRRGRNVVKPTKEEGYVDLGQPLDLREDPLPQEVHHNWKNSADEEEPEQWSIQCSLLEEPTGAKGSPDHATVEKSDGYNCRRIGRAQTLPYIPSFRSCAKASPLMPEIYPTLKNQMLARTFPSHTQACIYSERDVWLMLEVETHYGSWALFGLLFSVLVKRRKERWWRRFNFVLSSALDCSVAIAGILIFFAVFYTGASKHLSWWGTNVYKNTCDWDGCPYKSVEAGKTFGS